MPEDGERTHVSCRRCKHFQISWDPRAPYSCAALGFKSQQMPSLVVFQSSGLECQAFEPKKPANA